MEPTKIWTLDEILAMTTDETIALEALLILSRSRPTPPSTLQTGDESPSDEQDTVSESGKSSLLKSVASCLSMQSEAASTPTEESTVNGGTNHEATNSNGSQDRYTNDCAKERDTARVARAQVGRWPETTNGEGFVMSLRAKRRTSFRDLANGV